MGYGVRKAQILITLAQKVPFEYTGKNVKGG